MIQPTPLRMVLPALLLCPVLALTACQEAEAEPDDLQATVAPTEQVARQYIDAYNARDLAALGQVLADPVAFNGTDYDRDTFLGFVDTYWDSFGVLHLEPTHVVPAEEYVTLRVNMNATGQGEYMGHDVDGKQAEAAEIMLFRVEDGRVTEYWSNWDELGFLDQLGIIGRP